MIREQTMILGADVGKRNDPSAIAVNIVESRVNLPDNLQPSPYLLENFRMDSETHYTLPYLKRLPLEMPYPNQAEEFIRVANAALDKFKNKLGISIERSYFRFYIDVTGVGDGMIDLVKPVLRESFHILPCRFVHGDKLGAASGEYRVGKSWFANRLQVFSECRKIHISPDNPDAEVVANELLDFDIEVDESTGKDRYGAIRPGTHDDQVVALGLSCLIDPF
jgi:hypothetical protein